MLELGLWSALTVFSELAIVRLYATLVGGAAYFGNLFLLVATFAAACGLMAPRLGRFANWMSVALLTPLLAAVALGRFDLIAKIPGEFFWTAVARTKPIEATFDLELGILLLALAALPAPLLGGAVQGAKLRRVSGGAQAYLVLAAGGLAGATLFALQNQWLPSLIALVCVGSVLVAVCSWLASDARPKPWLWLVPLLVAVAVALPTSQRSLWSPYQRVDLVPMPGGRAILSNGFYISMVSNVPAAKLENRFSGPTAWAFKSMKSGDRVLVMGSGGGTADVREALWQGASHVTAVEIDPMFINVGLAFDPDQTYRSPKVEVVNTDGRRFLASSTRKFDFVFYPFVDSQTNASNHARFRLDSFLYTLEGLHLAYDRIEPGGMMIVAFATGSPWIQHRMYDLLRVATGQTVRLFLHDQGIWAMYAISKGRPLADMTQFVKEVPAEALHVSPLPIPTDDWPFFYSLNRSIPSAYLRIAGMMLVLFCALLLGITSKRFAGTGDASDAAPATDGRASRSLLTYAFFSGAAFFFIELRTISALIPVFGSTYLSQASSVIGIIACSLLGALSSWKKLWLPKLVAWLLLFGSVVVSSAAPDWFHPLWGQVLPSAQMLLTALLLPVFFAGYLYLAYVRDLEPHAVALMQKWNLIGGAVGGLAECLVIVVGFRLSVWIAMTFYLAAFVAIALSQRRADERDSTNVAA